MRKAWTLAQAALRAYVALRVCAATGMTLDYAWALSDALSWSSNYYLLKAQVHYAQVRTGA